MIRYTSFDDIFLVAWMTYKRILTVQCGQNLQCSGVELLIDLHTSFDILTK